MERLQELFFKYPLDFIADFFDLLVLLIGLVRFRFLTREMRVLVLLFFLSFSKDLISLYFAYYKKNNLYIHNSFSYIEIIVIAFIYLHAFARPVQKKIIVSLAAACLVANLFFFSANELSPFNLTLFRLFAIFVVLFHFNSILHEMKINNILTYPLFWFGSGLLIYTAGTLFMVIFVQFIYHESEDVLNDFWDKTQVLYCLYCVLAAVGLWVSKYDKNVGV